MNTHPIYFVPCAGLCNRIRALVSAILYAKDTNVKLKVLWKTDYAICTGPFYKLFDSDSLPSFTTVEEETVNTHRMWYKAEDINTKEEFSRYLDAMKGHHPYIIKSHKAFYKADTPEWLEILRSLRPHPTISKKGDAILSATLNPIVGVHIRRTDNRQSIQMSPSALFWQKMASYPLDTRFYVSSDSQVERDAAERQFPGRIITGPVEILGRATTEGIEAAMLDLYCLSRCYQIVGSHYSSFSDIAAAWTNKGLTILRLPS
jgi:hypothetical protein